MKAKTKRLPIKGAFDLPEGVIYLDGNSLGPLPRSVSARVATVLRDEWGEQLIKGWNVHQWMAQPLTVANRIGRLIGVPEGTTVLGDTLSIKVHQALSAALSMRKDRKIVLSDSGNFPSDLYIAEGLLRQLDASHELRVVPPEDVMSAIDTDVAVVMLTQVDYRTGRMHDMMEVTRRTHEVGAVMIWDLAHSAGAVPVDISGCHAEFAVGCTYKFLNGGPGAPAFIYVRPDIVQEIDPALSGWLGHDAPFAFEPSYRPAGSVERFRVGTPPVIQIAALDEALKIWDDLDMADVRDASIGLSELFISEVEVRVPELVLASPRDPLDRGSQVSFSHKDGYAIMQALIDRGVIGDYRAPDILRFGLCPLFLGLDDIRTAVDILEDIMDNRLWDDAAYKSMNRVT